MLPDDALLGVETPARYIDSEWNAQAKDPESVRVRLALCYPDVYQVGMDHLGLLILYHVANSIDGVAAERCFAPWPDAAAQLRRRGRLLSTLETQTPLKDCDLIGFTLQYELTYTTILAMLHMGGIPPLAADRPPGAPIVIAGGPGAVNPEPLAPFIDLFCIGDGEELLAELLPAMKRLLGRLGERNEWTSTDRLTALEELSSIPGVYWPAATELTEGHDRLVPVARPPMPSRTRARVVLDLDSAPFPTSPPVPWVKTIHDRGQIEIARGCVRGCRFCQAGMVYRPVRERSVDTLVRQAVELIDNTGYDELSLVSLNCPDYRHIHKLVDRLQDALAGRGVSIGLPSLRVDTMSVELAMRVAQVRKGGMTFAPEAGTQRLRDVINKTVTEQDLLNAAAAAFEAGWLTVKLYFMIGLPTETDEDVQAIAGLLEEVARIGRRALGRRARRLRVNVSVAALIPKPHTPFQWLGQAPMAELERKQALLKAAVRDRAVKVSFHNLEQSCTEAAIARGDRRVANAIHAAWRQGAYLDAWAEFFDFARWQAAFDATGRSVETWASSPIPPDEPLPWEIVDAGVSRSFLRSELARALDARPSPDCRSIGCQRCGVQGFVRGCPGVLPRNGEEEGG